MVIGAKIISAQYLSRGENSTIYERIVPIIMCATGAPFLREICLKEKCR